MHYALRRVGRASTNTLKGWKIGDGARALAGIGSRASGEHKLSKSQKEPNSDDLAYNFGEEQESQPRIQACTGNRTPELG